MRVRTLRQHWHQSAFFFAGALGLVFLILPLVLILPLSLNAGSILELPGGALSLRWYGQFLASRSWMGSAALSVEIALVAAAIATALGTLAAIGTSRARFRGHRLLPLLFVGPLILPTIVLAVALYQFYARLGLVDTAVGLMVADGVLGVPYVFVNVAAALKSAPRVYEEAALSLGARPPTVLRRVTLPLIWRGIAAGAIFAFIASFDEVVVASFLGDTQAVTLPKRIFDALFYQVTPEIDAIAACILFLNLVLGSLGLVLARGRRRTVE